MKTELNRRQFLVGASAAGLMPITGFPAIVKRRGVNEMLSHACIGCGNMAWSDLRSLMSHRDIHITALCDVDATYLAKAKTRAPDARAYRDWRELLAAEGDRIDSVNVSTPDHTHAVILAHAMRRDKHVYSQKPIGLTVDEATDMIEAAKAAGVKFSASPIHMLRPDIREAKALIDNGAIGKVLLVRGTAVHGGPEYFQYRVNDPSWFYEPGAGVLYDMGVHILTQVTGILGPAKAISCVASVGQPERTIRSGNYDGKKITSDKLFDNYIMTLDFGNGTLASLIAGYCVKGNCSSPLEIYGEKGSIIFTDDSKQPLKVYIDNAELKYRGWLTPQPQKRPEPSFFQCSCLGDLIAAIEEDRPTGLRPEHARHVIELMVAIEACAKDGKTRTLTTTF